MSYMPPTSLGFKGFQHFAKCFISEDIGRNSAAFQAFEIL